MAKRQSKADLILSEARQWVEMALSRVRVAEEQLSRAKAIWTTQTETYHALERQLAPKPRKKAVKEVTPDKKEPMCAVCAHPADHPDHDTTYLSSHPFALSVPKKSGRKSGEAKSTQNTETAMAAASSAAHAGD